MSLIPHHLLVPDNYFDSSPFTYWPATVPAPQLAVPTIHGNQYKVNLDLHQFDPSEISVKVEGNQLKIQGKREKKSADGHHYEFRNYEQHFTVPDSVHLEELKSQLDNKGILRLQAPVKAAHLEDKARHIPIEFVKK